MKRYALFFLIILLNVPYQVQAHNEVIALNNEGVKALNRKERQVAIDDFKKALVLEPTYSLAKDNMVITYREYGRDLSMQHKFQEALAEFHQAAYLSDWPNTNQFIDEAIEKLGKNPNSFADRIEFAEQASKNGDYIGAVVEYHAALKLKNDNEVHKRLSDAYDKLGEKDKAASELEAAKQCAH